MFNLRGQEFAPASLRRMQGRSLHSRLRSPSPGMPGGLRAGSTRRLCVLLSILLPSREKTVLGECKTFSYAPHELIPSQLKLKESQNLNPSIVYFRYNPPVVLVNMAIAGTNGEVVSSILPSLQKWYHGDEDSVSLWATESTFWTADLFRSCLSLMWFWAAPRSRRTRSWPRS